ncbi:hypothetical protein ACFWC9_09000 [Streptomyces goshikiensis]|uniref:hypothetical protein n=1 Tax=Streptomyces goshikiensis TaxID=1942 RepID=UPI0036B1D76E
MARHAEEAVRGVGGLMASSGVGFVAAGAVLLGVPAGMYLAARTVWEGRPGPWAALLFIAVMVLHGVGFWWAAKNAGAAMALAVLALNLSWMLLVYLRVDMRDDQTMHDRGVTEQSVVTRWIRTSDPFAGVDDEVTAIDVRLPTGASARLSLKGAPAPRVGESVRTTRDPDARVPLRLGPRPDAPGTVPATIALVLLITSSLLISTAMASATRESLR